MSTLLGISRAIDWINHKFAIIATWLVLLACLISAGNAMLRYAISVSSNAWLEIQWYMFAGIVMLGAPHTLARNEHVRVDLIYGSISPRTRHYIDLLGGILFLLPMTILMFYVSFPWFWASWLGNEQSSNAGGLVRWPVKLMLPLGFALLALQGISEIIKAIAALQGMIDDEVAYERPLQ